MLLFACTVVFILLIVGYYVTQNDAFIATALAVGLYGILAPKGYVNGKPFYGGEEKVTLTRDEAKKSDPAFIYVSPDEEKQFLSEINSVTSKFAEFSKVATNIIHDTAADINAKHNKIIDALNKSKEFNILVQNMSNKLNIIYDLLVNKFLLSNNFTQMYDTKEYVSTDAPTESFPEMLYNLREIHSMKYIHDDYFDTILSVYNISDKRTIILTRDESKKATPDYLYINSSDEKELIAASQSLDMIQQDVQRLWNNNDRVNAKLKCEEFINRWNAMPYTLKHMIEVVKNDASGEYHGNREHYVLISDDFADVYSNITKLLNNYGIVVSDFNKML